jgi:hypothetical protein
MMRQNPIIVSAINYTLRGACDRLVSFRQKLGQNRKVPYGVFCRRWVGLSIDNVGRRMPGKISLEVFPRTGQNSATRIETWDRSAEHFAREWKGGDITTGRASLGV